MENVRGLLAAAMSACLACWSCGGNKQDFDRGKAKVLLETATVNLDGEQVSLTPSQVECGVNAELWERPVQFSPERSTARLGQMGRDLKFGDDVVIEPNRLPYVQVRGQVSLQADVSNIRDAEERGTKLAEAKAGVKISHSCFPNPLPLMGVKKGNFQADVLPTFLFVLRDDGWHVDKMVH